MEIDMTAHSFEGSAKIYQFPTGGRARREARRHEAKPVDDFAVPRIARVTSGSAWYHEEAIRDAQGTRKN
jgi:hypothetical protein